MFKQKMWALLFPFLGLAAVAVAVADNAFTYTGTPIEGSPFTITWTPGTYSKVDIMLNTLYPSEEVIITTSAPIATEIDNTGSWVWNVPSDIQGRYSLSIARDFRFLVSYSEPFVFGPYSVTSVAPPTSIPQSTACTSASSSLPSPTGVNPFIFPSGDAFHVRVGIQSTIKWIPTTSRSISIILQPGDSPAARTNITVASKITNSGSYSWTPSTDLANNGYPLYSYQIILIDDTDPSMTSTSETIEVLSPSIETDFTGPYSPAVLGQPYQINWSPSNTPTISLILQEEVPYNPPPNTTIGDHIKNTGSFTWQVPSASTFVVPGVWWLVAIDDATGNLDARIQITIDATNPPTCAQATNTLPPPQSPDSSIDYRASVSSLLASVTGASPTSPFPSPSPANITTSIGSSSTAPATNLSGTPTSALVTILNGAATAAATAASDVSSSTTPRTTMSTSGGQALKPIGGLLFFLMAVLGLVRLWKGI